MGWTVREKHIRTSRRGRSARSAAYQTPLDRASISESVFDAGLQSLHYHLSNNDASQNPNPSLDDGGCGYCTEDQLEEILLKNLEFLYNDAVSKLVAFGYEEDVVLKAILRNGHCYGTMDILSNILHNSLAYLNSSRASSNVSVEDSEPVFMDLRQLEEYSLAGMVCLLQQVRPHLSKGDAMWCLLMSDLHVGRASAIEIPVLQPPCNGCGPAPGIVESVNNSSVGVSPGLCKFHGGWGFGNDGSEFPVNGLFSYASDATLPKDIECPKRFNLTPEMKSLLKRNVAMFAAGFRANSKIQMQSHVCPSSLTGGDPSTGVVLGQEQPIKQSDELRSEKSQDVVNSILGKFRDLNLDENLERAADDQKDEMLVALLHQIRDLEKQVKERKEWAHQKAMQAARKLSSDLTELKTLRMEREETQWVKKGKHTLEDTTMKRLSEMENALRKASSQVDRANAAVRRLESENAEIRAEMEASKLSASESVNTCLEVAKREKRCLKRLLVWEKQKCKLQAEISEEKQKISELQKQLVQINQAQKDADMKLRQELEAKDEALALVDEERRSKEAAELASKRRQEALQLKVEIDLQRHKDDVQRLEQELSQLRSAARVTELRTPQQELLASGETIAGLLCEVERQEDWSGKEVEGCDRVCVMCMRDEVSVVFLPCAHEVLCAGCSERYGKKGKTSLCLCCRAPIEQRVRVFGASSS